MITSNIEPKLYGYLIKKADAFGSIVHAIGGIEDHIHFVVSIPPSLAIADFVGQLKGSSAHYLNHDLPNTLVKFSWQRGYGVFSLGGKQLAQAVDYVNNQKAHHLQGTMISSLERDGDRDDAPSLWHPGKTPE